MRLDEKFCLKFVTDLTWSSTRLVDGKGAGCAGGQFSSGDRPGGGGQRQSSAVATTVVE